MHVPNIYFSINVLIISVHDHKFHGNRWIGTWCLQILHELDRNHLRYNKHGRATALHIPGVDLQGVIPTHLGNLSFLVSLDLSNNSFHGILPHGLSKLHRLKSLDLRENELGVPSFLSSLPELHLLDLSRNTFSGPIPATIANFSRLQELRLSQNSFQGKIPQEIGYLRALTFLNLERICWQDQFHWASSTSQL